MTKAGERLLDAGKEAANLPPAGAWMAEPTGAGYADMQVVRLSPESRGGKQIIAMVAPTKDDENAYLIAAAPDLYAVLDRIIRDGWLDTVAGEGIHKDATDVLAKARGAPPSPLQAE